MFHLDLYRLEDPTELEGVGMSDLQSGQGVLLVEWADRYPDALPPDRLTVTIVTTGEETRRFEIVSRGPMSAELLDELRHALEHGE